MKGGKDQEMWNYPVQLRLPKYPDSNVRQMIKYMRKDALGI